MRKLAKYDFSKCYGINRMTIHATLITNQSVILTILFLQWQSYKNEVEDSLIAHLIKTSMSLIIRITMY